MMPGAVEPIFPALGVRFGYRAPERLHLLPTAELPLRDCLRYAVMWQLVAFSLIAAQLLLVWAVGPVALVFGIAGLVLLFIHRPLAGATARGDDPGRHRQRRVHENPRRALRRITGSGVFGRQRHAASVMAAAAFADTL